jgi:hypothetical protein
MQHITSPLTAALLLGGVLIALPTRTFAECVVPNLFGSTSARAPEGMVIDVNRNGKKSKQQCNAGKWIDLPKVRDSSTNSSVSKPAKGKSEGEAR